MNKIKIPTPVKIVIALLALTFMVKLCYDIGTKMIAEKDIVWVGTSPYTYKIPKHHTLAFSMLDKDVVWEMKVGNQIYLRPAINDSRYEDLKFTNNFEKITVRIVENQGVKKARFRFTATPVVYTRQIEMKEPWSWDEFK